MIGEFVRGQAMTGRKGRDGKKERRRKERKKKKIEDRRCRQNVEFNGEEERRGEQMRREGNVGSKP
jgi:hypothetical protein